MSKPDAQRTQLIKETHVNDAGEVIDQWSASFYSVGREDDYIKLYIERGLVMLKGITKGQAAIFLALTAYMTYAQDGQLVYVNASMKRAIAKEVGCEMDTVTQAIKKFCSKGILRRIDRGCYEVNPYIVGRGKWSDIVKLRTIVDWQAGTFANEFQYAPPED